MKERLSADITYDILASENVNLMGLFELPQLDKPQESRQINGTLPPAQFL
jgi:hypothetical protein